MRIAHHPEIIDTLRAPTSEEPWRVLVSGCIFGWGCGIDGTSYGMGRSAPTWFADPLVHLVPFCPEEHTLGVPRGMPDIHGGDGFDVLDGTARVLDEHNNDLSAEMIAGGEAMTRYALGRRVDFAVLTDMSAACGSQVISDGCRLVPDEERAWQRGVGVAAACLLRAGIPVVSQRDFRSLERLHQRLDPTYTPDADALDHHEKDWFREYFGGQP